MESHTMTLQALASSHGAATTGTTATAMGLGSGSGSGMLLPTVNFDFEALRVQMSTFLTAFDGHLARKREEVVTARQSHLRQVAQSKEEVARKESEIGRWRGKGQDLVRTLERERREMLEVTEALNGLTRQRKGMTDKRERVLADINDLKQAIAKKTAAIQNQRDALNHHEYKNSPELKFFEENLGLRILGVKHDVIAFEFSHIDEREWERTFTLKVDVSQRTYSVPECTPMVDNMQDLVTSLNSNRDFYRFIKSMRSSFKALVQREKADSTALTGGEAAPAVGQQAEPRSKAKRRSTVGEKTVV